MTRSGKRSRERPAEPARLRWLQPTVLAAAGLAAAAGFAQFVATASLADVATGFGLSRPSKDGVAGNDTVLGLGLAVIRLGSVAALPLAAMADRAGRRRVVTVCAVAGLALTAGAGAAPGFWAFVAILTLARPLLSATNAVAVVVAAEVTAMADRAKAVSVIGAAYAAGAGIPVFLRAAAREELGFRGVFALAVVPLALAPLAIRYLREPDRYRAQDTPDKGGIPPAFRSRLVLLSVLTAAAGLVTGPANTFVFFFAEQIRGLSPSVMAVAVAVTGPVGLAGLFAGRWAADNIGRRATSGVCLIGIAVAAILTYNAPGLGVVGGYLMAMFSASVYTPASGAISAELFPTSCRSTAAGCVTAAGVMGAVGGLALFGFLAEVLGSYGAASVALAGPVVLLAALYLLLPETRGVELDTPLPETASLFRQL